MSAVRNIWTDLVDKRLWPLALVLLLALIAVPVLLVKPAPDASGPATPVADAGPAALLTDPAAVQSGTKGGPISGRFKNPFLQQHLPKLVESGTSASASSGPSSGGGSADSGSSPAGGGGGGGSTGGGSTGSSQSDDAPVTTLKVKFGPSGGRRSVRTLTAGQPLPTGSNPLIVLIEVKGETAEFLVSSEAQPQGDGQCKPNKAICAQLFLSPGETEFFDVTGESGTVQYQLDVLDITKG